MLASQFTPRPPGSSPGAEASFPSWLPASPFTPALFEPASVAALSD